MRTIITLSLTLLLSLPSLQAQTYKHTLGLRLSGGTGARMVGLTSNYRLAKGLSVEGIIQSNFSDNHTAHLLLKRHRGLVSRRFNFYYGGGLSLGSEESFYRDASSKEKVFTYGNPTVGLDVIGGIEFTLLRMNMSFDVKPNINLSGRQNWVTFQSGLSIRSVMVTSGQAKKRKRQRARARRQQERQQSGNGKIWPFN